MIRILLIDDSPIALDLLSRIISTAPDMSIVGKAVNIGDALEILRTTPCDVICADYYMPSGNADFFVRTVMEKTPKPILIISAVAHSDESLVFRLLQMGAVDVIPKPRTLDDASRHQAMLTKIRVAAGVRVVRTRSSSMEAGSSPASLSGAFVPPIRNYRMVCIGASTGGPQALIQIFKALPADFPLPIICIQHIGAEFVGLMINWLQSETHLRFSLARHGELPQPGHVYFASPDRQLEIDREGRIVLTARVSPLGFVPSVDVTFNALAPVMGKDTIAILLTGMGSDGAEGMKALGDAGALTLAQDEASSLIFSMPQHAIARGGVRHVVPLAQIPSVLLQAVRQLVPG